MSGMSSSDASLIMSPASTPRPPEYVGISSRIAYSAQKYAIGRSFRSAYSFESFNDLNQDRLSINSVYQTYFTCGSRYAGCGVILRARLRASRISVNNSSYNTAAYFHDESYCIQF